MKSDVFRNEIMKLINKAKEQGLPYVDIISGVVHRNVGGYPSNNHRMPTCCEEMYINMKPGDEVLEAPLKGKGANLKIRYYLNG